MQHGVCVQVDDDASDGEIKSAYRQLAKICHPDNAGEKGHNICILLNEVRHHWRTGYHLYHVRSTGVGEASSRAIE